MQELKVVIGALTSINWLVNLMPASIDSVITQDTPVIGSSAQLFELASQSHIAQLRYYELYPSEV